MTSKATLSKIPPDKKLTYKQDMVVKGMVADVVAGKGLNATVNVQKFYNAKKKTTAATIASENIQKPNFRQALIQALEKKGIIGPDGKLGKRLAEGLDAKTKFNTPQYATRLNYAKEINKILGVYAPTKIDQRSLLISGKLAPEDLKKQLDHLKGEVPEDDS